MYVSLSNLPAPPTKYQKTVSSMHGGMNTATIPSAIADHQCAELKNVIWDDGVLHTRPGMESFGIWPEEAQVMLPIAMHERVWNNHLLVALYAGSDLKIYGMNTSQKNAKEIYSVSRQEHSLVGCFFEFKDLLYFKGEDVYVEIGIENGELYAVNVVPYLPITHINLSKEGVGDLYQPENRLNSWREVWFNLDDGIAYEEIVCDGRTKTFYLSNRKATPEQPQEGDLEKVLQVYLGANLLQEGASPGNYSVNVIAGSITIIGDAPPTGLKLSVKMLLRSRIYRLPNEPNVIRDEVPQINVFVKDLSQGDYVQYFYSSENGIEKTFGYSNGSIVFHGEENVGGADAYAYDANVRSRFIKVQYAVDNSESKRPIDKCHIAKTYGAQGIESNCVVLAGAEKQKNAFFWSGSDSNGINPAYFPVNNYNIVGANDDPITAFGRQQNRLVIFQKNRTSAADFSLTDIDGRVEISLNVKTINDKIGCTYTNSVQLIENNLVWMHEKHGILYLQDSNYAYETLVRCISGNVNSDSKVSEQKGLLNAFKTRTGESVLRTVSSFDDGNRYWIFLNDKAFVWDYRLQGFTGNTEKLCWFYCEGISASAWAIGDSPNEIYGLKKNTSPEPMTFLLSNRSDDFGQPFSKVIQSKSYDFGIFSNTKNIETVIFNMDRSKTTNASVTYITDRERRTDKMMINFNAELEEANDVSTVFTKVRKPKCTRIREFAIRLDNETESDTNMISMQILYTVNGSTIKAGKNI